MLILLHCCVLYDYGSFMIAGISPSSSRWWVVVVLLLVLAQPLPLLFPCLEERTEMKKEDSRGGISCVRIALMPDWRGKGPQPERGQGASACPGF